MRITLDTRALQAEITFMQQFGTQLDQAEKDAVLSESTQAEDKVKGAMPVDTGRARTGWGHYTPELMVYFDPSNVSSPGDAVWEVEQEGKSITQGTNVPYTPGLNEGSSRQAPAGFIDAIGLLALEDLEKTVGDAAERLWSGR